MGHADMYDIQRGASILQCLDEHRATARERARRLSEMSRAAVEGGAHVTVITPKMCAEASPSVVAHTTSEARRRAAINGGLARSRQIRAQQMARGEL